jgi:hypothetical protein
MKIKDFPPGCLWKKKGNGLVFLEKDVAAMRPLGSYAPAFFKGLNCCRKRVGIPIHEVWAAATHFLPEPFPAAGSS